MDAQYPGTCPVCGGRIEPGDPISRLPGRPGWGHAGCVTGDGSAGGDAASRAPAVVPVPPGTTEVYTDGACSGNPGPGGWAWAVPDGPEDSGGEPSTTNQRMEIRAALEAVRALPGTLVVVSDSTYVVNCFRDGWWQGWQRRGWKTSAKKPVANRDLWEPLVQEVTTRGTVTFRWVKGHSADPMNDHVDALAVAASRAVRS